MKYKPLGLLVLIILISFPASAEVVSFTMVETGLREDAAESEYASLWEGGLMEAFFDAGHIVTNSPILRLERRPTGLTNGLEADFLDAIEGGAEFIIFGLLEFEFQAGRPVPSGITMKIYDTSSTEMILEQRFPAGSGRTLNEEYQIAHNAGRTLENYLRNR